mmetsp:Transcript_52597/g.138785  ORF Transcript_52597/g.138785 Transcript_52597/m.138785 type:complete len:366 (-) Transcript_52597:15-1112(-)
MSTSSRWPGPRFRGGLVRGDHVLDVDEGVLAAGPLHQRQGLVDQLAHVLAFPLPVVHEVAQVLVVAGVQVERREDLPVVRHQELPDPLVAPDHELEGVDGPAHDLVVAGVQRTPQWDDDHRDCRRKQRRLLAPGGVEEVLEALVGDRREGLHLLEDPVEEDRKHVVVVEPRGLDLPSDARHGSVAHAQRQVPALEVAPQRSRRLIVTLEAVRLERDAVRRLLLVRAGLVGPGAPDARGLHPAGPLHAFREGVPHRQLRKSPEARRAAQSQHLVTREFHRVARCHISSLRGSEVALGGAGRHGRAVAAARHGGGARALGGRGRLVQIRKRHRLPEGGERIGKCLNSERLRRHLVLEGLCGHATLTR